MKRKHAMFAQGVRRFRKRNAALRAIPTSFLAHPELQRGGCRAVATTKTLNTGGRMADHTYESEESSYEITSKRRKGYPSETQVKRGVRVVHGNKELFEKLGRNDLCPCGSNRSF
jgi:hypothetical protein